MHAWGTDVSAVALGAQRYAAQAGMFDDWFDQVGRGQTPCASCPLLPVCGGACPKLWRQGQVPCPSMKFNWPQRLDLAAAKRGFVTVSG